MILIVRGLISIKAGVITAMSASDSSSVAGEDRRKILRSFGARIRDVRQREGLSQEDLADRCGLDRTYVGGVERGERNIGLVNIVRLARSLSLSASTLLSGVE